jgi:hypothetical protein
VRYLIRVASPVAALAFNLNAEAAEAGPLEVSPRLDVVYDSNVARSSDEVAEARGVEQSDVRYSPGVLVSSELDRGRQVLFLNADLGYDIYQRNSRLNSERFLLNGGAKLQFARCSGVVSGAFSRRQADLADVVDLSRVKNKQTATTVGVEARCGGPVGLTPTFGASRSWTRNSDELRQYGDAISTSANAGVSYTRPSLGDLSVVVRQTWVNYADNDLLGADFADGYRVSSFGARFERRIGSRVAGSVGLYRTTVNLDGEGRDFSGWTTDADLELRISSATRATISAARNVQPANLVGGDYTLASTYGLKLEHALGTRILLNARANLDHRNIRGDFFEDLSVPVLRSERRGLAAAGANYKFTDRASVGLELAHERRRATPSIFSYSSTRALMRVQYAIGRRS